MTKREAPPGTQAVLRGIRLLKAMSQRDSEMTLLELSEAAGLTKTTTHRLLAALESEGLVTRGSAQNTYRLGPVVIAMGMQALRTSDLRAMVRPSLDRLAKKTGETATLEIISDNQMLILDEVSGRHLVSASVEIGTRWPLHATSTGKAVLAFLPEDEQKSLLEQPLAQFTAATLTDPRDLSRELRRIRKNGFATAVEEMEVGFSAVAAVFWGPMGDLVGAISVGGPSSRMGRQFLRDLGPKVKAVADEISQGLGHDSNTQLKGRRVAG